MTAAPKLLAGLMPVPVMGIVARWTMNTANPIGRGARTCIKTPRCTNHGFQNTVSDTVMADISELELM